MKRKRSNNVKEEASRKKKLSKESSLTHTHTSGIREEKEKEKRENKNFFSLIDAFQKETGRTVTKVSNYIFIAYTYLFCCSLCL